MQPKTDVELANEAEEQKVRAVLREKERRAYAEQAVIGIAVVLGFAWRVDTNTLQRVYPYAGPGDCGHGLPEVALVSHRCVTQYAVESLAELALENGFALVEGLMRSGLNWSVGRPPKFDAV